MINESSPLTDVIWERRLLCGLQVLILFLDPLQTETYSSLEKKRCHAKCSSVIFSVIPKCLDVWNNNGSTVVFLSDWLSSTFCSAEKQSRPKKKHHERLTYEFLWSDVQTRSSNLYQLSEWTHTVLWWWGRGGYQCLDLHGSTIRSCLRWNLYNFRINFHLMQMTPKFTSLPIVFVRSGQTYTQQRKCENNFPFDKI